MQNKDVILDKPVENVFVPHWNQDERKVLFGKFPQILNDSMENEDIYDALYMYAIDNGLVTPCMSIDKMLEVFLTYLKNWVCKE